MTHELQNRGQRKLKKWNMLDTILFKMYSTENYISFLQEMLKWNHLLMDGKKDLETPKKHKFVNQSEQT